MNQEELFVCTYNVDRKENKDYIGWFSYTKKGKRTELQIKNLFAPKFVFSLQIFQISFCKHINFWSIFVVVADGGGQQ